MKLSETVLGGEYWFFGDRGPYRTKSYALSAARGTFGLKHYERHLLRAVRVSPAFLQTGPKIEYGSGEAFQVMESFPLDEFGDLE